MSRFFQQASDEEEEITTQVTESIIEEKPKAPKGKVTKDVKPAQGSRFQVESDSESEGDADADEAKDKIGEISESKPDVGKAMGGEPEKLSKRALKKLKDDEKKI